MGDVWRGLEVVEAATRVGSEMLVRNIISIITQVTIQRSALLSYSYNSVLSHAMRNFPVLHDLSSYQGDSLQNLSNGLETVSYRVPLGVCAGIGKKITFDASSLCNILLFHAQYNITYIIGVS